MTSVKMTGATSVYFNYQVWTLAEGEQVDGALADYLIGQGVDVEVLSIDSAPDTDGDGVPDGTAAQVLEWVGIDPERAAEALAAEQKRGPSRSTLVAALAKLAAPADPAPAA